MTDFQKNRPPTAQSSEDISELTADDEDIIVLQDEVAPTEETDSDFQHVSPLDGDADDDFVSLTDEVAVDAEVEGHGAEDQDDDIISLIDELSADEAPDNETGHGDDEDLLTLTDEIALAEGSEDGLEEGQDEEVISLTDQFSFDAQTDEIPAQSQHDDLVNPMDELAAEAGSDDGLGESEEEEVINLTDQLSFDAQTTEEPAESREDDLSSPMEEISFDAESDDNLAESEEDDILSLLDELSPDDIPGDGSGQSPREDLTTPTEEAFLDSEAHDELEESQDEDLVDLVDQLSLDARTDEEADERRDRDVNDLNDQRSSDAEPGDRRWESQQADAVTLSEDADVEPADQLHGPAAEPAGGQDSISDMPGRVEAFAESESKHKESHNVTDTIDMRAKKQATSMPREEILPLTDEPAQEVIVLNEDIDLKVDEITDERAAQDKQGSETPAAGNLFDFGLQAALVDENNDQPDDGDSKVELDEITPLEAEAALDSDSILDEQILEVVEFDEDLSEVENPALEDIAGKVETATDDGILFDDDSAEDVLNVEDLEADSDDSEIDDLIHDFFEETTPAVEARNPVAETQPNQLESEIQFPDDFFDDDEFKFTFDTKDISDKIDQLADTSAEGPDADVPPVFPLRDDSGKPVKSPEDADFLAISEAQLDAAVQRVIERNFRSKIEILIGQAIEKAVSQEIARLKRLLLDKISGEDAD